MTPASLQGLYPEFASELTSRVQSFIDMAANRVSESVFTGGQHDDYDNAVGLVAAHLLTMANRRGTAGAMIGRTVGPVSAQFAAPSTFSSGYKATSYGQEYLALCNLYRQSPAVI